MKWQRRHILILPLWLLCLFAADKFVVPDFITGSFAVASLMIVVPVMVFRPLAQLSTAGIVLASLAALFIVNRWSLGSSELQNLDLPIGDLIATLVTALFAMTLSRGISRTEAALEKFPGDGGEPLWQSFDKGQVAMYREVRRARMAERPLSVLSIKLVLNEIEKKRRRLIPDVETVLARRVLEDKAAEAILQSLGQCDILTKRDDHFVVLMVETDLEKAHLIQNEISADIERTLNQVSLIGNATFPVEEVTLTGLLNTAEARMTAARSTQNGYLQSGRTSRQRIEESDPSFVSRR